jgi:hypothetical protein
VSVWNKTLKIWTSVPNEYKKGHKDLAAFSCHAYFCKRSPVAEDLSKATVSIFSSASVQTSS